MTQTHAVSFEGATVTKRYVSWARDEHLREWTALQRISASAPDLVPTPLGLSPSDPALAMRSELAMSRLAEPVLSMSLVAGRPLGGALTAAELDGLEAALRELWSIPADGLAPVGLPALVERAREGVSSFEGCGIVAEAHVAAAEWLRSSEVDRLFEPAEAVIGHGDPNLSNYLWDGIRVRIVDFEDAGRSDLAVELANLVEHISARETDWTGFVSRFPVDRQRFLTARRLWSIFWLILLRPGAPSSLRNPPDTRIHQSTRVLTLLNC